MILFAPGYFLVPGFLRVPEVYFFGALLNGLIYGSLAFVMTRIARERKVLRAIVLIAPFAWIWVPFFYYEVVQS